MKNDACAVGVAGIFELDEKLCAAFGAWYSGLTHSAVIPEKYKKDNLIDDRFIIGQICHGFLRRWTGSPLCIVTLFSLDRWCTLMEDNKPEEEDEELLAYTDWVLNRSPWAESFLTKDAKFAVTHGVVSNVHVPSNIMIGGLQAYRAWIESPSLLRRWFCLSKKGGISEDVAFLLAPYSTGDPNMSSLHQHGWGMEDVHLPLKTPRMGAQAIKAFLNSEPLCCTKPYYEKQAYSDVTAAFESGPDAIVGPVRNVFKKNCVTTKSCWHEMFDTIENGLNEEQWLKAMQIAASKLEEYR